MRWRRAAIVLVPLIAAGACKASETYVYSARKYEADAGCLDPYKSVDLVNGDSVSSKCDPNCFLYGGEVFTSTVCPPIPELATELDAEAPECKAAVALYAVTCGRDAAPVSGDAAPATEEDAGKDVLDAGDGGG